MSKKTTSINKSTIGRVAYDWLMQSNLADVWGITSSGIFLNIHGNKIIFLTSSNHFGPVNIVIENQVPIQWKNKDLIKIVLGVNEISFINQHDELKIKIDDIWHTTHKPSGKITRAEQQIRLLKSAQQFSLLKNGQGFASLLISFLRNEAPEDLENEWLCRSWEKIVQLKQGLMEKDTDKIMTFAKQLIGSGRGLTPSGDDLLTGLFFMQKRWFENIDWMEEIKQSLIQEFQQYTTAVSNTLFLCALQGEADARIQEMSDALMISEIPFHQQAIQLARWGNSSGADVFLGMMLAIASFQNQSEG